VAKSLKPSIRIYAVESETGPPLSASLAAGHPVVVDYRPSFIDGIASRTVFPNMLDLARRLIDGVIVLRLEEAAAAIRLVAERARVLIEGAAACAVAGALKVSMKSGTDHSVPASNAASPIGAPAVDRAVCPDFHPPAKIAAIVSGGNINLEKFCELCR
jgi:threonine dehydratase